MSRAAGRSGRDVAARTPRAMACATASAAASPSRVTSRGDVTDRQGEERVAVEGRLRRRQRLREAQYPRRRHLGRLRLGEARVGRHHADRRVAGRGEAAERFARRQGASGVDQSPAARRVARAGEQRTRVGIAQLPRVRRWPAMVLAARVEALHEIAPARLVAPGHVVGDHLTM
jgi:hypothetical protein